MKINRKQVTVIKEVSNMHGHNNFNGEGSFFSNHSEGDCQYGF
jgi:hypothetical protein